MKTAAKTALLLAALGATAPGCGDGPAAPALVVASAAPPAAASGAVASPYPPSAGAMTDGATLPDLAWQGLGEGGEPRTIALHDYFEPNASRSRVLVVRVNGGAWCGTCLWHAAHTGEVTNGPRASRLRWLDLVVGDADNAPARPADLPAWRGLVDAPAGLAFGVDPSFALRALGPDGGVLLPLYVFVDTRTMRVHGIVSNPDPAALASRIEAAVAELDGAPAEKPAAAPLAEPLVDGIFHRNEWDMIRDVVTPAAPPPDPTNAVADSAAAAALGKALFFDAGLSAAGTVSCATCHDPAQQLSDGRPTAMGVAPGSRKTPRIALAAFSRWQFWDGRADGLWSQALGPIENAKEMGSSRVAVVRRLATEHRVALAAAFPALPLPDLAALPESGKPGEPAYDLLPASDQDAVTRVFVAAGKALAAYERTFRVQPNALDVYAKGDAGALSAAEKQGLALFARVGCMQCHWGPRLTDDAFHVTRLAGGQADGGADPGRSDGLAQLRASEFLGSGRWSDAPANGRALPALDGPAPRALVGAFKTPSLRGIAAAGPYGHGGTEATLVSVTESYGTGGLAASDPRASGDREPWLIRFDVLSQWAIPPFLATLAGEPVVP